jgi:putative hydroxymethylpyrimidine transport system substrate-binding protein
MSRKFFVWGSIRSIFFFLMTLSMTLSALIILGTLIALPKAAFSASSASSPSLMPVKVALDWYINPDQAPILVAYAEGFFKEKGLDVEFLTPTDVNEPIQMLAMGKVDVATTYAPHLIMEAAHGAPLIWLATSVRQPLDCLTVLNSSGIKNPGDLKGKTIGYSSGAFGNSMLKAMLAQYGLSLKDVNLVNVKMNLIQALLTKRVDAVAGMMRFVEPVQIQSMGYPVTLFYPEDYGVPSYDELIFIANSHAQKANPELYQKFLEALTEGAVYLKAHPEKSWEDVSHAFPDDFIPAMTMAHTNHEVWRAAVPYFTQDPGVLDRGSYEKLAQYLVKNQLISKAPSETLYLPAS